MLKGFRDFIMRGNVIDLAVAVVIGSAFAAIVDTVVSSIITPVLNAAGSAEVGRLGFHIVGGRDDTFVDLAAIINAVVVFLITAAVVYFAFVVPMNKFTEMQKKRKGIQEDVPEPTDTELLTEIRDLLKAQRQA